MKKTLVSSLVLLGTLIAGSCAHDGSSVDQPTQVKEAGKPVTMKHFIDVNVVGSMQVFYTQDSRNTVRVEAQREELDNLVIYVKENELYVTSSSDDGLTDSLVAMQDVKVYVTSPVLRGVTVTGEGSFTAAGAIEATHLDVSLTGSGSLSLAGKVTGRSFKAELVGDGCVSVAELTCNKLDTRVTGSGTVSYASLAARDAESVITGVGTITIRGVVAHHSRRVAGAGVIDVARP